MKGFVPMSSSRREGLAREALENGKELAGNGVHHPSLLDVSPIVPVSGLALAPWRLNQVAGRSVGQFPHATLDIRGKEHNSRE